MCLYAHPEFYNSAQEKFDIHHYQRNADEFCSLCLACKRHTDVQRTITDFRANSWHRMHGQLSNEEYMLKKSLDAVPAPMLHGVFLCRFAHDVAHSQLLGTSKVLNGACLTYLTEAGEFGAMANGPYEANLQPLLRAASVDFKMWLRESHLAATQPRFTASRLHRKNRAMFPCLASKAVNGKRVSFWLAYRACERSLRCDATFLDTLVAVTMWSYCEMLRLFDQCPLLLSRDQAAMLHDRGMLHLLSYARLRALSARTRGKTLNRASWIILPKHHFLQHALDEALTSLINPGKYNLLAAESWVGQISRMSGSLVFLCNLCSPSWLYICKYMPCRRPTPKLRHLYKYVRYI